MGERLDDEIPRVEESRKVQLLETDVLSRSREQPAHRLNVLGDALLWGQVLPLQPFQALLGELRGLRFLQRAGTASQNCTT